MNGNGETSFVADYKPDKDARVALRNGRFLDVINGCYLHPETVVTITGDKIESVGGISDVSNTSSPDFAVDLQGKTVLPGLFNTHCHVVMTLPTGVASFRDIRLSRKHHDRQLAKNMAECLAHGVTTLRDAWVPDLGHNGALKDRISRGEIPGPRMLQSVVVGPLGSYLSEERNLPMRLVQRLLGNPIIDYERKESGSVVFPTDATESQVRDAVDRAVDERGAECIKIGEQLENMVNFKPTLPITTSGQLRALTEQANRRNMKTTIHHVSVESFRRAVDAGVSSLAHAPYNARLTQGDVEAFIAAGGIIEPTSTVSYDVCWKIEGDPFRDHPQMEKLTRFRGETFAALADEYWIPELRDCVKRAYPRLSAGRMKALGFLDMSNMFKYYSGVIDLGTENLKMLFDAGACFACGNDGGVPSCTPAMVQHELTMLAFAINGGQDDGAFTGIDAARIATINSARALGLEKELGSIEAGKIADLAVIEGDPLEDFRVIGTRVGALFMNGRLAVNNCGLQVKKTEG